MKRTHPVLPGRRRAFASLAACLGTLFVLVFANPSAYARQIVESICSASQTRGFDPWTTGNWFGTWPEGALQQGVAAAVDERCGPVSAAGSVAWSADGFTHAFAATVDGYSELAFVLRAGREGMTLRVAPGSGLYRLGKSGYEPVPPGAIVEVEPDGEVEFFSDLFPDLLTGSAACNLVTEAGEIAGATGLGGFWEAWVVGSSWTCSGTRAWGIGSGDLDCGPDADACDPSGGWFGIGSDADSIDAVLYAGPWPSQMTVRCEFLLATDCCVSYTQVGGSYCDSYPAIDGAPLPRPSSPFASCIEHDGAIALAAGRHVLEVSASDLGDGAFTLVFRAGDCGPDCDGNGLPDSVDIGWAEYYDGVTLDTDGDGALDSCERAEGDLDLDGWIGPVDLALLLVEWGSFGAGDLDGDGTVGAGDLRILLGNWRVPD